MKLKLRGLITILVSITLLMAACTPPSGLSVSVTCSAVTLRYQGSSDNPVESSYPIDIFNTDSGSPSPIATGDGPAWEGNYEITLGFGPLPEGTNIRVVLNGAEVFNGSCTEADDRVYIACTVSDGRVNSYDCAAPIAIYCTASNLDIYKINPTDGIGELIIRLPLADLPDGSNLPDENYTITEAGNVLLSYLTDGKLQVNTTYAGGKAYAVNWEGCPPTNVQTIIS